MERLKRINKVRRVIEAIFLCLIWMTSISLMVGIITILPFRTVGIVCFQILALVMFLSLATMLIWLKIVKIEENYSKKYILSCFVEELKACGMQGITGIVEQKDYTYKLELYTEELNKFPFAKFMDRMEQEINDITEMEIRLSYEEFSYVYL